MNTPATSRQTSDAQPRSLHEVLAALARAHDKAVKELDDGRLQNFRERVVILLGMATLEKHLRLELESAANAGTQRSGGQ